tara:strand:- start:1556 stop:1846 length:291 start_codon:yes stop_codon:yes gene_type:complete
MMKYELVDDKTDDEHFAVRITEGKYIDTIYRYNEIKVTESDDDYATLKFDYHIMEGNMDLHNDTDFEEELGHILHECLIEAIDYKAESASDKGKKT